MRNYKLRNKIVTDLNYYKYKYSDKFYTAPDVALHISGLVNSFKAFSIFYS